MTKRFPRLSAGRRFVTTAAIFDALNAAGLLRQLGVDGPADGRQWPIWGIDHGPDRIECELIDPAAPAVDDGDRDCDDGQGERLDYAAGGRAERDAND